MGDTHWLVVRTRAQAEEVAERALRRAGYRTWLPWARKHTYPEGRFTYRGHYRKPVYVMRPWLTGYLFVQEWRAWTEHDLIPECVLGLAKLGTEPAKLSDKDVQRLRAEEWHGELDDPEPGSHSLRRDDLDIGQQVSAQISGRQVEAIIESLSDNGKAIVRALLFGGAIKAEVRQSELQHLEKASV